MAITDRAERRIGIHTGARSRRLRFRRVAALAGQARRSAAAIPYHGFAEFEAAVDALRDEPGLADAMGAAGREFVRREYDWEVVLGRYEELIAATMRGEVPLAPGSA